MIHHSLSHGAVSLASLVGTQMLADKISSHFPSAYEWIESFSGWIINWFDLSIRHGQMEVLVVGVLLGMVWGGVFWHLSAERVIR